MEIIKTQNSRKDQIDFGKLGFGEIFSDHMFSMDYINGKWVSSQIIPYGKIEIFPSMCSLHYGQIVFEGLKAFFTRNGTINIFRPEKYHNRLNHSCRRLCIPEIDYDLFMDSLKELVFLDKGWIPKMRGYSLYIRPFVFAIDNFLGVKISESYRFMIITSPVGAYYREGINPVRLVTSSEYIRAAKGGLGAAKTPANYAGTLLPAEEAHKRGFTQVLWLDGIERKYIEEVGTMNIFFLINDELITPPLEGTILGGVMRDTVLHLSKEWGISVAERKISIDEVQWASREGRLKEVFGTGTAAVISPIGEIQHNGNLTVVNSFKIGPLCQKLYDEITGIQYGERRDKFNWCYVI